MAVASQSWAEMFAIRNWTWISSECTDLAINSSKHSWTVYFETTYSDEKNKEILTLYFVKNSPKKSHTLRFWYQQQ